MSRNYAEHARVTAICVNMALDTVEADIRSELLSAGPATAAVLERLLRQLRDRRINHTETNVGIPSVM